MNDVIEHDAQLPAVAVGYSNAWLSQSIARVLLEQSPLHAWQAHPDLNPAYKPEEREDFDIGSAAHALLLQGEDRIVVIDAKDWRTKDAKEQRDAARAESKYPLLAHKATAVREMVVRATQAFGTAGLKQKEFNAEVELRWLSYGVFHLRGRLDLRASDKKIIVDYKTTSGNAEPSAWIRAHLQTGFEVVQPAFYLAGNQANGGPEDAKFLYLVQETYPPYACSWIGVSPAMLAVGQHYYWQSVQAWARCVERQVWPAYLDQIHWAEPSPWQLSAQEQDEQEQISKHGIEYDPAKLWGNP